MTENNKNVKKNQHLKFKFDSYRQSYDPQLFATDQKKCKKIKKIKLNK